MLGSGALPQRGKGVDGGKRVPSGHNAEGVSDPKDINRNEQRLRQWPLRRLRLRVGGKSRGGTCGGRMQRYNVRPEGPGGPVRGPPPTAPLAQAERKRILSAA